MFNSTVFILGAGASCEYGYPTGEDLVKEIRGEAENLSNELTRLKQDARRKGFSISNASNLLPQYVLNKVDGDVGKSGVALEDVLEECKKLIERIDLVHPPVIDYFLHKNPDISGLGAFLISLVILKAELKYKNTPSDQRFRKGRNWYRYVIHKLMTDCDKPEDLLKNDVRFITFNYDTSLEYHLVNALNETAFFSGTGVVESFFNDDRIIHVYGKVEMDKDYSSLRANSADEPFFRDRLQYDLAYNAANGIRTIAPTEKMDDAGVFDLSKNFIDSADTVYILGYGFDKANNKNIGLDISLKQNYLMNGRRHSGKPTKKVFFTNFENKNSVNKRVSEIFFGNQVYLLSHGGPIIDESGYGAYYERSELKVYDALSSDFDL